MKMFCSLLVLNVIISLVLCRLAKVTRFSQYFSLGKNLYTSAKIGVLNTAVVVTFCVYAMNLLCKNEIAEDSRILSAITIIIFMRCMKYDSEIIKSGRLHYYHLIIILPYLLLMVMWGASSGWYLLPVEDMSGIFAFIAFQNIINLISYLYSRNRPILNKDNL